MFFQRFYNIFRILASLGFPSVPGSVCTQLQVKHQGCSRICRVQKNHNILKEKHNISWTPCSSHIATMVISFWVISKLSFMRLLNHSGKVFVIQLIWFRLSILFKCVEVCGGGVFSVGCWGAEFSTPCESPSRRLGLELSGTNQVGFWYQKFC